MWIFMSSVLLTTHSVLRGMCSAYGEICIVPINQMIEKETDSYYNQVNRDNKIKQQTLMKVFFLMPNCNALP